MKLRLLLPAILFSCTSLASAAEEHLGTVDFPVSCASSVQAPFNRGVALLHSFWYEESEVQFAAIARQDPQCAMAHWGVAMSIFHQIWERPDDATNAKGWKQMQEAQALLAKQPAITAREREYIATLSAFYKPGPETYETRIDAYSAGMAKLHADYPGDVDGAALYALSLLAATAPSDLSLANNRAAMAVLAPLFAKYPDNPGVDHYITHACDTPAMASEGLAAAQHYEVLASSVPHGVHMPSHIYARLGMWQPDIRSNSASVADSQHAEMVHQGGVFDQLHADDFLLYAYLQSANDAAAKALLKNNEPLTDHLTSMAKMGDTGMADMIPYFRVKLPVFYMLETRDWNAAMTYDPRSADMGMKMTALMNAMEVNWGKAIGAGHLQRPAEARAALAAWEKALESVKGTPAAYLVDSAGTRIEKNEMAAWVAFAAGNEKEAIARMQAAADEQDKVGQGEVDIPAREMLGDIYLESKQPQQALAAYRAALVLSPGRFNGLYHAGLAAEAVGKPDIAAGYYKTLLKNTDDGKQSTRPEFNHVKTFLAGNPAASTQAE
jgi:tetratricopeptide (TPR) repeat protein